MGSHSFKAFVFYCVFIITMLGGAFFGMLVIPEYYGLIVYFSAIAVTAVVGFLLRNNYISCFIVTAVNGFVTGVALSCYYINNELAFYESFATVVSLIGAGMMALVCALCRTEFVRRYRVIWFFVLSATILGSGFALVLSMNHFITQYLMILFTVVVCFIPTLLMKKSNEEDGYKHPMMSSFGIGVLVCILFIGITSQNKAYKCEAEEVILDAGGNNQGGS